MFDDGRRWGDLAGQHPSDPAHVAQSVLASIRGAEAGQIPARLCALSTELLSVTGASISLMAQGAVWRLLCSSDDAARQLAEVQYTLGDGPCPHAFSIGAPVFAADLSKSQDARRWPVFALRALEVGAKAVFSFPLGIGAISAGTLDLYRDSPGPLAAAELGAALLIADAVTLCVLRLCAGRGETEYAEGDAELGWLSGQVDHDEVHQATGMVMIQCDVGAQEALLMLRARAFASEMTLTALAHEVVNRRMQFGGADEA